MRFLWRFRASPWRGNRRIKAPPKWDGYVEGGGKLGTKRHIGEVGLFLPIAQDDKSLLFADFRGSLDDNDVREGNFGLAYRRLGSGAWRGWILGGYGFFDRRRTESGNIFLQGTVGVEALSEQWDFRINGYLPEAGSKLATPESTTAATSGTGFTLTTLGEVRERALPGFDVEAGYKLPLTDLGTGVDARVYAGAYHFDAAGFDNVTGPRGRFELDFTDLSPLPPGSNLLLGAEVQWDDVRGAQAFAVVRLHIPFGAIFGNGGNRGAAAPRLSKLERRMTRRIERDVDIVAGDSQVATLTESGFVTNNAGVQITAFTQIDAGVADLSTAVTAAGANSLLIIDGSAGTVNDDSISSLAVGQIVAGGGASLTVSSASGRSASVTLPGAAPTVNGTGGANVFQITNDDGQIISLTITGGGNGILITSDNVLISGVTIDNPSNNGFAISTATNLTIEDTLITNATNGMINNNNTTGISFTNVTITDSTNGIFNNNNTLSSLSGTITTTNVTNDCFINTGSITNSTLFINGVRCGTAP